MNTRKGVVFSMGFLLPWLMCALLCNCDRHDDGHNHAHGEEITHLKLSFTYTEQLPGGEFTKKSEFTYVDEDGTRGSKEPVRDKIALTAGRSYAMKVEVWNDEETAEHFTKEIVEEQGEAHQYFFIPSDLDWTHKYADKDKSGRPVGAQNTCGAGGEVPAGTGKLRVVLRHEPNKSAEGHGGPSRG